jgi:group II intron reverse transcriptase/maturase
MLRRKGRMKLLDEILQRENLDEAFRRVYANKGASGVDGVTVEELSHYRHENEAEILDRIRKRNYKPQPVRRVEIPKGNGKMRKLGIPTVMDRMIQQAIAQVLIPIFEKQFSEYSYGYRPYRSCEQAVLRSLDILNGGYTWVVDIDLERFFDTVNHDRLMNILHRSIDDGDVLSIIRKFLESGVMENGIFAVTDIGTPQGGNLSPLLSNVILNELDKELEKRGLLFVRYADDCNIFLRSKKAADRVLVSISNFIEKKLGLRVNITKSRIGIPEEIKFLGFGYFKDKTGIYRAKPHKESVTKMKMKLKFLSRRHWSVSLDKRLLKVKQLVLGWVTYFRISHPSRMISITKEIDCKLRRRIRVVIWIQWKCIRKRYDSLRKLGISHQYAFMAANCRKGVWFISKLPTVQAAISNKRLKERGLISLQEHYQKVNSNLSSIFRTAVY